MRNIFYLYNEFIVNCLECMKKISDIINHSFLVLGYILIFIIANSCKKNDVKQVPILTTNNVNNISYNTASCGGIIKNNGGFPISSKGLCWSTSTIPDINDNRTIDGTENVSFTNTLTGLSLNTKYYVRAYAINMLGPGYGNTVSLTTPQWSQETVTDIDGNIYNTVAIGNQIITVENSRVKHYNNGDPIPFVSDNTAWANLITGGMT